MARFPFEASLEQILKDPEPYVDAVFSSLESEFLIMPKGPGFIEYPFFERGYESLKAATKGFTELEPEKVFQVTISRPISIVVLRTMLGFTPPEWAYLTSQRSGISVTQGFIRTLDRRARMTPETALRANGNSIERLKAPVETACQLLGGGVPELESVIERQSVRSELRALTRLLISSFRVSSIHRSSSKPRLPRMMGQPETKSRAFSTWES